MSHGQVKKNVSWLFPEDGDVDRAAAFFRNLLWTKETMGQNTKSEASHIFKAFDETYEAKRPLQSASMHWEGLVGPHLEGCAFHASEPRFVGELCGALARRPL